MGFDLAGAINTAGSFLESAVGEGEKAVGSVIQTVTHEGAQLLDEVGLKQLGDGLESLGAMAADRLGANVDEKNLGQTEDPKELIHGDVGAINGVLGHLGTFAAGFEQAGAALAAIDAGGWQGAGATAFHHEFDQHPKQWTNAADAMSSARTALSGYNETLSWAQKQAAEAIARYKEGVAASDAARAQYNSQVDQYNAQASAYNAAAPQARGPMPTQPGAFVDPGVEIVAQAQAMVTSARQQRNTASAQAQSALSAATALAPEKPAFLNRLAGNAKDLVTAQAVSAEHLVGGALLGAGDFVKTVRSLNPQDPYNITHPAAYTAGLAGFGSGLVHSVTHPVSMVKSMAGTGWGSDPSEALGKLIPQIAAAVVTDGGSAAGTAVKVADGVGASERVAAAARGVMPEAKIAAREPKSVPTHGDPVDVTTGAVTLPQVDLQLDGLLPLRLGRTHLSAYRAGRWFGASWCSSFDQRVEVDAEGVVLVAEDGMLLTYPHPRLGEPVLAEEGPRWLLSRTEAGGYQVEDPSSGTCWHFRPRNPRRIGRGDHRHHRP